MKNVKGILRVTLLAKQNSRYLEELIPGAYMNTDIGMGYVFKVRHCKNNCCSPEGALIVNLWIRETDYNKPRELERI